MAFKLLIAGMVFLCNPMIAVLDVLPDFLGYGLILLGLNRLSAISPELDDSRPYFRYLLLTSVARTLVFFASGTFDDVMKLSVTLIFAVIELGIALMAIPALYDGLAFLNIRYGGQPKETPEFKTVGIAFFGARGFLSLLPMLGYVMDDGGDELINSADQMMTEWAEYTGLLTVVNVVLTLIFAIFWMATVLGYIGKLAKDTSFNSAINAAYAQKRLDNPGYFTRRTLCFAFSAATAGSFFLIDLIGDGINCIPDFVFGILMLAVLYLIRNYTDSATIKAAFISGGIYTFLSTANFICYNIFMRRRYYAPFDKLIALFPSEYIVAVLFALADGVSLIVFARYLFFSLKPVTEREITPDVPENFVKTARDNERFIAVTARLLMAFCILLAITGISTALLTSILHIFPEFWMINLAVNIIFFCISVIFFSKMISGVRRRYNRDGDE